MDSPPQALVIGEALVDVVRDPHGVVAETAGGSPLNVAVTLARLGVRTQLLTGLGDDQRADLIQTHLEESGVELLPGARRLIRTSTATASLQPDGSAHYEFDLEWDPTPVQPPTATFTHAGSIGLFLEPGADLVRRRLEDAACTSFVTLDPNIRPTMLPDLDLARAAFERLLPLARIVKLSDEDAAWLYPGMTDREVSARLLAAGPALVAITRGGHGCTMASGGFLVEVPAARTTVVDTIGAGDSFMGALIHQVILSDLTDAVRSGEPLRPEELDLLGRSAAKVAAITVGRPGADPPWLAELVTVNRGQLA
ncbi:carbohydrate kinase [Nocardioides panacihumi]|uniref:Carbohydrate kinase n=1 Tax=Nocardioides panacihumi TaxID=400774 RepID=A0ABP5C004_9ACTN